MQSDWLLSRCAPLQAPHSHHDSWVRRLQPDLLCVCVCVYMCDSMWGSITWKTMRDFSSRYWDVMAPLITPLVNDTETRTHKHKCELSNRSYMCNVLGSSLFTVLAEDQLVIDLCYWDMLAHYVCVWVSVLPGPICALVVDKWKYCIIHTETTCNVWLN